MKYLHWDEKTITDFSPENIGSMYERGYVFTRLGKGVMHETRSVRIDLKKFELTSENRRILKKIDAIDIREIPLPYADYSWSLGKLAKDFYDTKFGSGIFSVVKIKEILTSKKSNFNILLDFGDVGFAIGYGDKNIFHYSYPFYDLKKCPKDMGLGMMVKTIVWAKEKGLHYMYLGSLSRPGDVYKLQFRGIEWWDGDISEIDESDDGGENGDSNDAAKKSKKWQTDIAIAKKILHNNATRNAVPKHIHIVGICGVATSALAIAFHKKGWLVTGSDKGFYPPVSTALEQAGISFYAGWHPEKMGIESLDKKTLPNLVVAGASGTSLLNPEIVWAKEHAIPVLSFAEALGKFFIQKNSIVTVGTWGKTTTSAILSFILLKAGMNPSYFTGGLSLSHDTGAMSDSDWSVAEGDEYQAAIWDRQAKFVYYSPTHLLLTSVSWDHADLYPTEKDYFDAFEELVARIPPTGLIVYCVDDVGAQKVISKIKKKLSCNIVTYGTEKDATYRYHSVSHTKDGISFSITRTKKTAVKSDVQTFIVTSPMLGRFNAENIAGCFAMACEIGIDASTTISAIAEFKGIRRRLEKRYVGDGITVLDCHAPTPEKAASVLESIREVYDTNIIAIFEPNIGGRQRSSIDMYRDAFKDVDYLFIPRLTKLKIDLSKIPSKIAPDATVRPLEGDELAAFISKTHSSVAHATYVEYIEDDKTLVEKVVATANVGSVIVFLGSHGFRGMIEETIAELKK